MHTADVARGAAVLLLNVKRDVSPLDLGFGETTLKKKLPVWLYEVIEYSKVRMHVYLTI
jgi:hypothetical protein